MPRRLLRIPDVESVGDFPFMRGRRCFAARLGVSKPTPLSFQTSFWQGFCLTISVLTLFIVIPVIEASTTLESHSDEISGYATYYTVKSAQSEGTSGMRTANGEVYDETAFTCALPFHQFGGLYKVCLTGVRRQPASLSRCVVVRHNDFGPGRGPRRKGVVIDLTPVAFRQLASLRQGKIAVTVEAIARPKR